MLNYHSIMQHIRQSLGTAMPLVGRRWGKIDPRDKLPLTRYSHDPLATLQEEQDNLLKHGKVVWSALIQANWQLFRPLRATLPGEILLSHDNTFDMSPNRYVASPRTSPPSMGQSRAIRNFAQ